MLDVLRIINLSLLSLFIGLNLAIWKRHYEVLNKLVIAGRTGLALSVIISISSRLLDRPQSTTNKLFNIMLTISILIYTAGLLVLYTEKSKQEARKEHDNKL
jgi:hypothetical protein